jgi:hypothetical protein
MNPTRQHSQTPRSATGLVVLLAALLCLAGSGASAVLPASASAFATIEGPPIFSSAPGLPDGRAYEQVSPADKSGNEAGGSSNAGYDAGANDHYGLASADGNAVLFEGTGPMGESPSDSSKWFVATKKPNEPGWSTRSLLPATISGELGNGLESSYLDPSSDLSHAMVEDPPLVQKEGCGLDFIGPDPFLAPVSLEPVQEVQDCQSAGAPVGGTPDFSTVYFTFQGVLLPQDAERALHPEAWGFYEDHEGVLREAGVLPGQTSSPPFGAVPAASGEGRNRVGNQISEDGSRVFFVSPDPASCTYNGGQNECAVNPPELYVRENGERTLLVSRDTLLPETGGLPASAPGGVLRMPNPTEQHGGRTADKPGFAGSFVFASPDGSQAFFVSTSALTQAAAESSPGAEPKTYDFDADTGALTYLPGVVPAEILAVDGDGSSLAFVRAAAGGELAQLDLWTAGPGGGTVTPVTHLPEPGASVPEARMSSDGSVLVFQTASRLSGAFNSVGEEEIYRYDVPADTLGCVSCAPAGVTPGAASISAFNNAEASRSAVSGVYEGSPGIVDGRGISADGDRIFFETPSPLVPQDKNTNTSALCIQAEAYCAQGEDVYEWENGVVYLISTGKSPRDSYYLDSSANGDDVFFATAEGLVPGDTDGGYDVYDARIPHAGEPFPPAAVPCEGSVCQGPPNVPSPLTPPASATFNGLGNPTEEVTPPPAKKVTTKTVKCKKTQVKRKGKCVRRKQAKKSTRGSK